MLLLLHILDLQLLQEDLGYAEVQKYYLQLFEQEMDTRHTKLLVKCPYILIKKSTSLH